MSRRDDHWLRELYDTHWRGMVRLATLLMGSDAAAEEIVVDALVATHRRRRQFADQQDAADYLRTAVVNRTRQLEQGRVRQELGAEADQHERVLHALDGLPQRQREVLVLMFHARTDEATTADALGISRNAVRSHAHRGQQAVRAALAAASAPGGGHA